ncbi:MAG: YggS family pyridoxal phosphate-dependent enzyme [Deltaproteobacteria bacterium]|nr:YggS family pyridoxal phosphate-dependent enzyme [Deltaproteobacteria bacterium]
MTATIEDNIAGIRRSMAEAALRSGRDASAVRLMAVTKTVDERRVGEAIAAGVDMIGENYVQEAQRKIEAIGERIAWHMIGHLQTNKAKYAVKLFDMVHSVDSIALARELDRRSRDAGRIMGILIEVNSGGEATKSGASPEKVLPLIREAALLKNIAIRGLMTMPPWFDDPEKARPYFATLRELRDRIVGERIEDVRMEELSMGMSSDYRVAIEEGATIVRVGRGIFGERPCC